MVIFLILLNVVFFLATVINGGFSLPILLRLGAKYGPLIATGEWQRLLLCIFLHGSLWHLFFNMYALYNLGRLAEGVYGTKKFFTIFILTGLCGSLLSFAVNYSRVGVGASGAIFGLAGALFASGLKYRNTSLNRLVTSLLPFIVINLVFGFITPVIDNGAHIGGLLSGMFLGWVISPGTPWISWKKIGEEVIQWILIVFIAIAVVTFFLPIGFGNRASMDTVITFHNQVQTMISMAKAGGRLEQDRVEALVPPDRDAQSIKERLIDFYRGGREGQYEIVRIEQDFLVWRDKILEKYQGLIQETE